MDDKIKQLIEVKKEYPNIFDVIKSECPSAYGLNDCKTKFCDRRNCIQCWEDAIEEVKDNAD